MERYAVIDSKLKREFVLLQGSGCRWHRCRYCDYYDDVSADPYIINKEVLNRVTGRFGVLDVINSGSAIEFDDDTIELLQRVVREKGIRTLWFEMHYMYHNQLADFAALFPEAEVKFRCGIETFDGKLRKRWNKGVSEDVTPDDVARYFKGICILCCTDTEGDTRERILNDIEIAKQLFEYFSVNVFCNNSTAIRRNEDLVRWFVAEVYPSIKDDPRIEVLLDNTDLGVGEKRFVVSDIFYNFVL